MAMVRVAPKEAKMNKAEKEEPKTGHGKPSHGDPGPERKASMHAAMEGEPTKPSAFAGKKHETSHMSLRGAAEELREQHPHGHADHGPHHGTRDHIRHMPLHGLKP